MVLKSQGDAIKGVAAKKIGNGGSHLVAVEKQESMFLSIVFFGSAADSVMLFRITHLTSPKWDFSQQHDDPAKLLCCLIFAVTCT